MALGLSFKSGDSAELGHRHWKIPEVLRTGRATGSVTMLVVARTNSMFSCWHLRGQSKALNCGLTEIKSRLRIVTKSEPECP